MILSLGFIFPARQRQWLFSILLYEWISLKGPKVTDNQAVINAWLSVLQYIDSWCNFICHYNHKMLNCEEKKQWYAIDTIRVTIDFKYALFRSVFPSNMNLVLTLSFFCLLLTSRLKTFRLFVDVNMTSGGLWNVSLCSAVMAFEQGHQDWDAQNSGYIWPLLKLNND